jgi:heme exporter protein D
MQWHSAAEFFAMGGYAVYVWGSVGACAVALTVEPWLLRRRHRELVQGLRRRRRASGSAPQAGASAAPRERQAA